MVIKFFVTTPVESFIEGVLWVGCAVPPGLLGTHNNHRYWMSKPIFAADILLDKRTVEELLPRFVNLIRLLKNGEFPQLRQDMAERAEHDAATAPPLNPSTKKNGTNVRWTPAFTEEVRAYRETHGPQETVKYVGVSDQHIRKKLAESKSKTAMKE